MQFGLLSVLILPFDSVRPTTETNPGRETTETNPGRETTETSPGRETTETSPGRKTNSVNNPPSIQVRYEYRGRSTFMSDHREDNTNDRLLEPYDTPISAGTIRAVVVVGLITLFVASFLYWQSWKERHKKPPCVTKLKQGISDVVNAQCSRVRANRTRGEACLQLDETRQGTISAGDRRGQRGHNSGAIPGRIKPEILRHSPVPSSSSSTSRSPSTSSSIYHSPASSQMIFIYETFKPTKENVGEMLTVAQSPRGYNLGTYRAPSEQLILHV